ncbi:MAG: Ig-like domain-containing protein [Patescibacteria group bacterium]
MRNLFRFRTLGISLVVCAAICAPAISSVQAATLPGNATFDKALWFSGAYTDQTTAASDVTANDTSILASSSTQYSYWGLQSPFDSIYFWMSTWGSSGSATFEYSSPVTVGNVEGFSGFLPTSNLTNSFTAPSSDDIATIGFTPPSDWVKSTVEGVNAYWIRISGNSGYVGTPKATAVTAHELSPNPPFVDTTVSVAQSSVSVVPSIITADGVSTGTLTVVARNDSNTPLSGEPVTISSFSSSTNGMVISPAEVRTDNSGTANFTIKSNVSGKVTVTAVVGGVTLNTQPMVTFVNAATCPYPSGLLVKLPDDGNPNTQEDSAVYYYGKDCKRHAFPNDKVYFSWYSDFNNVTAVSDDELANMTLGTNVTYRPGVKMVKFTTVPKTYAVARGGVLRWVTSESIASSLYGAIWNTKIDDINDAFYANYTFGADINSTTDYIPSGEMNNAMTINDEL